MVGETPRGPRAAPRLPAPAGLLALPFTVGVVLTLIMALGMGDPITLGWVLAAVLVGLILAAAVFATKVSVKHPAKVASAAAGVPMKSHHEAMGGDPLAHIHAVEQQGRRHRRPCVNCGTPVKSGKEQCANCGHLQVFPCKGCKTQVRLDWKNCPECGRKLP